MSGAGRRAAASRSPASHDPAHCRFPKAIESPRGHHGTNMSEAEEDARHGSLASEAYALTLRGGGQLPAVGENLPDDLSSQLRALTQERPPLRYALRQALPVQARSSARQ